MRRSLSTREKVLSVGLVVAAFLAYRALTGDGLGFGVGPAEEAEARQFGEPPLVRMDLLARGTTDFDPGGRDLFRYYKPPPPPRPKIERKPKPPPPRPRETKRPKPPPAPTPVAPQAPTPRFSYLGFLGPKEAKIAVFELEEGLLLKTAGDVVEDDFRLLAFEHDGVTLGYTDSRWEGRTTELKAMGLR